MRVFVYYNLHKHCLSIRSLEGPNRGRVMAHASMARLEDVTFKVSQAGRARVLAERRKNVHAGVTGQLCEWLPHNQTPVPAVHDEGVRVSYNPYLHPYFYLVDGEQPIHQAARCSIYDKVVLVPCADGTPS